MNNEIKKEWLYEQSPNEVWEYLTRADLLSIWLMPNNFKPEIGHEFQFHTNPMPSIDLDGIMHCKVLDIIPLKRLVYSWNAGRGDGNFSLETVVEWTLEAHGNGSRLLLKQSGFKESNLAIFTGMTDGWEQLIAKMTKQLNDGR